MVSQVESKELLRFSNLRNALIEVVNGLLTRYKAPTKEMIQNLINIEMGFINTNHPDFVGADGAISIILERMAKAAAPQVPPNQASHRSNAGPPLPVKGSTLPGSYPPAPHGAPNQSNINNQNAADGQGFLSVFFGRPTGGAQEGYNAAPAANSIYNQQLPKPPMGAPVVPDRPVREMTHGLDRVPNRIKPSAALNDKETFETELIKHLLESYFNVVRKNVKDTVPKSIIHFLVNKSKEKMQNELVTALYREDLFDELLEESSVIQQRRDQCKSMMTILRKAHDILNEVREFQV